MNTKECISLQRKASESKLDRVMESQQFDRIVEAILAGKYSWACVLILRYAGYNPLHYIPYRTYNRLMKNNSQRTSLNPLQKSASDREKQSLAIKSSQTSLDCPSSKINDLSYLEVVSSQEREVRGGNRIYLLVNWDRVDRDCDDREQWQTFLPMLNPLY